MGRKDSAYTPPGRKKFFPRFRVFSPLTIFLPIFYSAIFFSLIFLSCCGLPAEGNAGFRSFCGSSKASPLARSSAASRQGPPSPSDGSHR